MTTFARISKSLMAAWLCLFALVDARTLPQLVLCIGEDGHVEVESAVEDRCGQSQSQPASDAPAFAAGPFDDHCGDCSDILLVSATAIGPKRDALASEASYAALMAAPAAVIRIGDRSAPASFRDSSPAKAPRGLAAIRSVRILV